jgi:tRNA A37 threonylcarbamoyladenosine biosynthesis protein TsaE
VVIEWAEKLGEMPDGALSITFRHRDEETREIEIEGIEQDELHALMREIRKS